VATFWDVATESGYILDFAQVFSHVQKTGLKFAHSTGYSLLCCLQYFSLLLFRTFRFHHIYSLHICQSWHLHPFFVGNLPIWLVVTFLQRYCQVIQSSKDWKTFLLEGGANNAVILTSRSGEFTEKYSGETARKTSGFEFKERESTREQSIPVNRLNMTLFKVLSYFDVRTTLYWSKQSETMQLCYRNKDENIPFECSKFVVQRDSTTIVSTLFFLWYLQRYTLLSIWLLIYEAWCEAWCD
jgi:hypothetical protein